MVKIIFRATIRQNKRGSYFLKNLQGTSTASTTLDIPHLWISIKSLGGPRKKEIAPALLTLVPGSCVHFLLEISYPLRPMTFIQGILSILQDQKWNIKRGPELREFCLPRWESEEGIRISLLLVLSRMFLNGEIWNLDGCPEIGGGREKGGPGTVREWQRMRF